jgi:hypothetical protein
MQQAQIWKAAPVTPRVWRRGRKGLCRKVGKQLSAVRSVIAMQEGAVSERIMSVLFAVLLLVLGIVLSYFGYVWGDISPNPNELFGSLFVWGAVIFLVLRFPLRQTSRSFWEYVRMPFGIALFAAYMIVHLVLYGFLLEGLLTVVYGAEFFAVTPAVLVTTNVFSPPSLTSTLFDLAYNPSVLLTIAPVFSAALSLYTISVSLVIAVLVVANVGRTRELGALCTRGKRARSFIVLPALGILFGASCCLSVAGLISLAAPSALILSSEIWIYYLAYFILPALAVVLLYLNLHSIEKISTSLRSSLSA